MNISEDDKIYVRFRGRTLGPLTSEKVHGLVKRGQITRMHELSADGLSWLKAEEFGDFFQSPTATSTVSVAVDLSSDPLAETDAIDEAFDAAGELPMNTVANPGFVDEWYAHVNGENQGPVSFVQMKQWKQSGAIHGHTLTWRSGLDSWQAAEEALPGLFPKHGIRSPNSSTQSPGNESHQGDALGQIAHDLNRRRGWTFFIAVVIIVFSSLQIIGQIVVAIAAGNQNNAATAIIGAIIGIVFGATTMTMGVMLIQYCNELRQFELQPTSTNCQNAIKRLNAFWVFTGIACLVTMTCIIVVAVSIGLAIGLG